MKRILLLFLVSFTFVMCKPKQAATGTKETTTEKPSEKVSEKIYYTESVRNDFRAVSENTQFEFLEAYKATEKQYAILFFTQGFNGEELTVKNDNGTLFKGSVLTDKDTGLAKNMRILNTETTSVYDKATRKTIYIHPEKIGKHKFVYIMKGDLSDDKPYKITYSDKLRPEK
ncbi:MAG TPA: hypothetical protein VLY87_05185 [Flavobacterium sp.]|nr:hypothetical protein [Flavobacterium sp.]